MTDKSGQLQKEIQQSRPFASKREEAILGLLRTADMLRHQIAKVVGAQGLTHQQYNVLRILRGAGEDGLPVLEIASRLIEQSPGITRFVDQLESRNLIVRVRCQEDRRRIFCKILPAGLALLDKLEEPVWNWTCQCLSPLKAAAVEQLIDSLDRVRRSF